MAVDAKELFVVQVRPQTPQCDAQRSEVYANDTPKTDRQCKFRSRYKIDGRHLCTRHAQELALQMLLEGNANEQSN